MDEAGSDEEEVDEEEMQEEGEVEKKVYVPGIEPLQPGEKLEMDRSAYRMYHECQTGKNQTQSGFSRRVASPEVVYCFIYLQVRLV